MTDNRIPRCFLVVAALLQVSCTTPIDPQFIENLAAHVASHDRQASRVLYNHASKHLAVGTWDGIIEIWDTRQANRKITIKGGNARVDWLHFSDDGKLLFTNAFPEDDTKLWNTYTGALVNVIQSAGGPVAEVPGLDLFIIGDRGTLRIYDRNANKLLSVLERAGGVAMAIAADSFSRRFAVGSASGTVEVFELVATSTGYPMSRVSGEKPYETGDWVMSIMFGRGGNSLYTLSRSGALDEWSVPGLQRLRRIPTGTTYVASSRFIQEIDAVAVTGGTDDGYATFVVALSDGRRLIKPCRTNLSQIDYLPPKSSVLRIDDGNVDFLELRIGP